MSEKSSSVATLQAVPAQIVKPCHGVFRRRGLERSLLRGQVWSRAITKTAPNRGIELCVRWFGFDKLTLDDLIKFFLKQPSEPAPVAVDFLRLHRAKMMRIRWLAAASPSRP
jgi:hypothetical protein